MRDNDADVPRYNYKKGIHYDVETQSHTAAHPRVSVFVANRMIVTTVDTVRESAA